MIWGGNINDGRQTLNAETTVGVNVWVSRLKVDCPVVVTNLRENQQDFDPR
jgi:hypothetical protein